MRLANKVNVDLLLIGTGERFLRLSQSGLDSRSANEKSPNSQASIHKL
jgi:hypothetical protein